MRSREAGCRVYWACRRKALPHWCLGIRREARDVATAIRIGKPARGEQALQAAEESGGRIIAVSDEEILAMQRQLAGEGFGVEPASAAGLAGLQTTNCARELDPKGLRVWLSAPVTG